MDWRSSSQVRMAHEKRSPLDEVPHLPAYPGRCGSGFLGSVLPIPSYWESCSGYTSTLWVCQASLGLPDIMRALCAYALEQSKEATSLKVARRVRGLVLSCRAWKAAVARK